MPYVTTDSGTYLKGKETKSLGGVEPAYTLAQAEADAKARNARAEQLGIKTRYMVVAE